jgi:hypothetical protein
VQDPAKSIRKFKMDGQARFKAPAIHHCRWSQDAEVAHMRADMLVNIGASVPVK